MDINNVSSQVDQQNSNNTEDNSSENNISDTNINLNNGEKANGIIIEIFDPEK